MDPHALDRIFQRRFAGEIFGHAGLHVAAFAAVEGARRIERQQPRGPRARRHLAELELDRLMLADRLAEGLADLGVFARKLERAFGNADAARGDIDASEFEPARRLEEALAFDAADQMIGRNAIILENQLRGIDRLVAELRQFAADRKALHLRRDEQAHAVVARLGVGIGLDQHREARAFGAVGDPRLGAVDDVMIAVAPRGHADALQVGAGVRLGQGETAANLAGGKLRQPARLLLRRAEFLDRKRQHQMRIDDAGDRHPDRRDAHDDLGVGASPTGRGRHIPG